MPPSNMSSNETLVISPSPRGQLSPYKRKQEKCKTTLSQLWGDQEWYPERVRSQHKHREIQPAVLEKLIAVTNLALRKGIEKEDLPTLWDEDGALSWAMAQQDSRLLTVDVCNKAMEYLENHREADEAGNQAKSPAALHHPQAIEQEVLVKVEPSNSSGADEDLPADSEPTQHSSPTKKRKASSDPIDLTNRTPPPERDRLTKERQQNARLAAEELYSQLHSNARLEDEPIFHMCEVSFALYHTEKQYLLDCLWFEVDSGSLPAKLQDFPQQEGEHYLPLHHRDPEHWTLCVLVVTEGRVHCAFYDPLEGGSTWRAEVTESRLKEWIDEHYPSLTFAFEKKACVEQDDGVSCGVFVLVYLRRLLMSESVNKTLDPIKARAELWDDVLRADASSLLLKEGTRSLLREIQALEKEKNDSDAVAQVSAPRDITGEPLNSYPLFEKLTRPGNLDVFREECQKKMQALETAQSNLQAARRAHLNAAEKAAWTQEAFDDVSNSLAKIGESYSTSGVPSRAPEKDLAVTLEDSHPADPMRSSDTPVRNMSVIISKAVTDCERVAQEMQREMFNRVIEKKIAAGRQRVKIEEQRESELSEEVKKTTNEVAALQRVIKVAEGRLELENEESRAYLERFYTSM